MPSTSARLDLRMVRALLPFVAAYKGRAAFAITLLIAAKVATVAVPLVLRELVDTLDGVAPSVAAVPIALLVAYGALRLSSTLFRQLQSLVFERVRRGIMRRMALRVVGHLHDLSLRYHLDRRTGELASDLGRGTNSASTLLNQLLFNILPTLVEVTLVTIVLLTEYDARYALVGLVTFGAYGAATFTMTAWRMKYRTELNRLDATAGARAIDALLNYETVKYFGAEDYELGRYDDALRQLEDVSVKSQASLSLLNVVQGALIAVGVTVIMILASQGVVAGELTIGDLVAVNAFLLQLFAPLGFLGMIYSMLKHALNDMERMFDILDRDPEIADRPDAAALDVTRGEVRFERVAFSYDPERPILHDVDFTIAPGEKVAVVGASGAGKSTLARLLFRFYDVTGGRVSIDGQDVRDVTQRSLRDAIAIVPQDTVLFNDTLAHNIRYGRRDATDAEVAAAADAAHLTPFITQLPDGMSTVVGERGLKLSGGEKQRVAIARAILKQPAVLVFDEATSSLDSASEQAILTALRALEGDRSTLVIAHRLSTIVDADRIIVLDGGRVVETGTHAELVDAGGPYAQLWDMQRAEAVAA